MQAVNEELYQMVSAHPDRFSAFATLPVGVPEAAAAELERAVTELGFVGTMICGTIGDQFLDEPHFAPILEAAARLDVPIYLHPAPPPKRIRHGRSPPDARTIRTDLPCAFGSIRTPSRRRSRIG